MGYRYDTLDKQRVPEEKGNNSNLNWRKKRFGRKEPRKDKGKKNIQKKKVKEVTCLNCLKKGHYSDKCKNPWKPGMREPFMRPDQESAGCYYCRKPGHRIKDCPTKKQALVAKVYAIRDDSSTSKAD